jgi:hypothetical protein
MIDSMQFIHKFEKDKKGINALVVTRIITSRNSESMKSNTHNSIQKKETTAVKLSSLI